MAYAENNGHIFDMTRHMMRVSLPRKSATMYRRKSGPEAVRSTCSPATSWTARSWPTSSQIFEKSRHFVPADRRRGHRAAPAGGHGSLARKIIAELQALGVRVALDDVGTGHGGMAYLQKLGVDIIKIDKMFIDTIGSDDNSTTIVDSAWWNWRTTSAWGSSPRASSMEEQIERLLELGVTAAQGYHFAPPMPANEFIAYAETLRRRGTGPRQVGSRG
jgi:hypothetical protein